MSTAPRTAFVLAGGASLGAMQVGMLRALYERGIAPDLLVGTSAGALNAAFIASRPPTVQTAKQLARVWCGIRRRDLFPIHAPTLFSGLANQRDHVVSAEPLRCTIRRHLQLERLEDAAVPLHIVTFDVLSGQEVRLSEGPALDAVLASAAIPGVLPPVSWGARRLVDGGVVNNTPISHAVELGATRIYILPTADPFVRDNLAAPRGALDAALRALSLAVGSRCAADLELYRDEAELILLPASNPWRVQPAEFDHAERLTRAALHGARSVLADASIPLERAA